MPIVSCTLPGGGKGFRWGGHGHCYPTREGAEKQAAAAHANGFTGDDVPADILAFDILAFDRASVRTIDVDGRLHVAITNISKANICSYRGDEIPDFERLGLDARRVYQLWRDPEELAKAAPTFSNLPVLNRHIPVTAQEPQKQLIVGSTGTDAVFKAPYLQNSLVIWDAVSIAGIETREQCEVSSAYRYRADMTPGEYRGEHYDGRMTDIIGNHVAIVEKGRAGPDVVVGDAALPIAKEPTMANPAAALSRKALFASGAMRAHLLPKLAQDQQVDLNPVFKDVTAKNFAAKIPSIVQGIAAAVHGKLAQDADIDSVTGLLNAIEQTNVGGTDPANEAEADPGVAVDDDEGCDLSFLDGKISPEDMARLQAMIKPAAMDDTQELPPEFTKKIDEEKKDDTMPPGVTKTAMDAAIKAASDQAVTDTMARMKAIRAAEQLVRPHVGELSMALDSAEAVFKLALDAANVDLTGVPPAAYAAMVRMLPKPGIAAKAPALALDAASAASFATRFPNASRIGVL